MPTLHKLELPFSVVLYYTSSLYFLLLNTISSLCIPYEGKKLGHPKITLFYMCFTHPKHQFLPLASFGFQSSTLLQKMCGQERSHKTTHGGKGQRFKHTLTRLSNVQCFSKGREGGVHTAGRGATGVCHSRPLHQAYGTQRQRGRRWICVYTVRSGGKGGGHVYR